jgi:hypothetical protein
MRVTLFYLVALAAQRRLSPFGIELSFRAYLNALINKSGDGRAVSIACRRG